MRLFGKKRKPAEKKPEMMENKPQTAENKPEDANPPMRVNPGTPGNRPVNSIPPIITERRNGMVHQYQILHFQCDECGNSYEYRSDEKAKAYTEYRKKNYCPSCWEQKQRELKEPCPECGRLLTICERRRFFNGLCRECWIRSIGSLRKEYAEYRGMLEYMTAQRGIRLEPPYTDGLDETGRPLQSIRTEEEADMLPLREGEYALYLMNAGDGIFAFPDNGIGLRYVRLPSDRTMLSVDKRNNRLLAAGSDGKDLYILTDQGILISTNPELRENAGPNIRVIDIMPFCRETAGKYFTEEQIDAAAAEFCRKGISEISNSYYYDSDAKKFFYLLMDGNYYHGYDVSYANMKKEEVIAGQIRNPFFSIRNFIRECREGKIPILLILERLPWEDGPYTPPEEFRRSIEDCC